MFVKRMSFVARLILTNAVYTVPIVVLTFQMFSAQTVNIDFGEQEKLGNQYQRPLESLLKNASLHRIYSQRILLGDSSATSSLQSAKTSADEAFAALGEVDARIGAALQFTPEGLGKRKRDKYNVAAMKTAWDDLKTKSASMSASASTAAHQDFVAGVRTMITHAGDTSNLILDPDLDSYYLMDVTLAALPQIQDHYQDVLVNVEAWLRRGTLTEAEKTQAAVYAFMLRDTDLARLVGSMETAWNEDANFFGISPTLKSKTEPLLNDHKSKSEAVTKALADIAAGKPVSAQEFAAKAESAIESSYQLWFASVDELDVLLNLRLSSLRADRSMALYYSAFALLAATLFATYIGFSLRSSVRSILNAVTALSRAADLTTSTSSDVVESANSVASATTQQASAVQETVSTLNEIDAMVGRSVEAANLSLAAVQQSNSVALEGKASVEEMIETIAEIDSDNKLVLEAINESNQRFSEIVKLINEISSKTQVINDIVFQTKLLSFNASVEAARAGEHGKGFAVVAEEVGNLAAMSGRASKEIKDMLSSSVQRVELIVSETKESVSMLASSSRVKVESGSVIAQKCGGVLDEVVTNVSEVSKLMTQIASSQTEQAQGVNQISSAMTQIDSSTQQNANNAQRVRDSAAILSRQAEELRELVSKVQREVNGGASTQVGKILPFVAASQATAEKRAA